MLFRRIPNFDIASTIGGARQGRRHRTVLSTPPTINTWCVCRLGLGMGASSTALLMRWVFQVTNVWWAREDRLVLSGPLDLHHCDREPITHPPDGLGESGPPADQYHPRHANPWQARGIVHMSCPIVFNISINPKIGPM